MKRTKAILLLLALTYWQMPQLAVAQEKYVPDFSNYEEPVSQVMDSSWGDEQLAYENWLKAEALKKYKSKPKVKTYTQQNTPTSYDPCSCVSYARWATGINVGPIGVARNHPVIKGMGPSIGAVLITYESSAGHMSKVVDYDSEYVYVDEANYSSCRVTYRRAIPLNSKLIKGYYK